jgi:hypothetical protein
MRIKIESLTDPTERFFMDKEKAFAFHYTNGGTLYKRRKGIAACWKPWATGTLRPSVAPMYVPFMIDGRKPEDSQ